MTPTNALARTGSLGSRLVKPFLQGLPFSRAGLYLKPCALRTAHCHLVSEPSPYALALRSLAADYPILYVFTIPEAINLAIQPFRTELGSRGSKELPAIRQCCRTPTLTNSEQGRLAKCFRTDSYPHTSFTDPFCRLPLSTLFYRLEAVHLGDLMRL